MNLINTGQVGALTGLAILPNNNVYITGTGGDFAQVNLNTGALTPTFTTTNVFEALGNSGNNLIAINWNSNLLNTYTTSGALVNTTPLSLVGDYTGLDSGGSNFYTGNYSTGVVSTFNSSGALVSSFSVPNGGSGISGLAYDPTTSSIWVSNGFSDDVIRRHSPSGTLLQSSVAGSSQVNALDVAPSALAPVPEPGTWAMMGIGLLGLVGVRRKKQLTASKSLA